MSQTVICMKWGTKPDPDEAMIGQWPRKHWWQAAYKYVRPAPWIAEHWR